MSHFVFVTQSIIMNTKLILESLLDGTVALLACVVLVNLWYYLVVVIFRSS